MARQKCISLSLQFSSRRRRNRSVAPFVAKILVVTQYSEAARRGPVPSVISDEGINARACACKENRYLHKTHARRAIMLIAFTLIARCAALRGSYSIIGHDRIDKLINSVPHRCSRRATWYALAFIVSSCGLLKNWLTQHYDTKWKFDRTKTRESIFMINVYKMTS